MTNDQIRNLIIHLDDLSPFLRELHRRFFPHKNSLSTEDRLVYPMGDQAFGIHFVRAYHHAGAWLPNQIGWPSIWRAFCCLRYDAELRGRDDACFEALALGHPVNRVKQARIKGLLCAGLSYEEVGKRCGISSDVIEVYAHLFFDFLERQNDDSFVLKVLNPRLDLSIFNRDKTRALDPVRFVMRVGYCLGPEAVVKVLGMTDERNGPAQEGQPLKNMKDALLFVGEMKAKLGLLEPEDAEFALLRTLIAAEAKLQPERLDDDFRMGLGRMSMSQSAQSVLKGLIVSDATGRLQAEREYDAQVAAEEAKRKAAGGGGPVGGTNGEAASVRGASKSC